jgi:cyanosortase A-associated protein
MIWNSIRLVLLAIACGGALATVGKLLIAPKAKLYRSTQEFKFPPQSPPLKGWQLLSSTPSKTSGGVIFRGRTYIYRKADIRLKAEIYYSPGPNGHVPYFLKTYKGIQIVQPKIMEDSARGIYALVESNPQNDQAKHETYLTACINPHGFSTFTGSELQRNGTEHGLRGDRLFPWLVGQQTLIDTSCLWSVLALPQKDTPEAQATDQQLQNIWPSWYDWWFQYFRTAQQN